MVWVGELLSEPQGSPQLFTAACNNTTTSNVLNVKVSQKPLPTMVMPCQFPVHVMDLVNILIYSPVLEV